MFPGSTIHHKNIWKGCFSFVSNERIWALYTRFLISIVVRKIIIRIWRAVNGGSRARDLIERWPWLYYITTKVWPFLSSSDRYYSYWKNIESDFYWMWLVVVKFVNSVLVQQWMSVKSYMTPGDLYAIMPFFLLLILSRALICIYFLNVFS